MTPSLDYVKGLGRNTQSFIQFNQGNSSSYTPGASTTPSTVNGATAAAGAVTAVLGSVGSYYTNRANADLAQADRALQLHAFQLEQASAIGTLINQQAASGGGFSTANYKYAQSRVKAARVSKEFATINNKIGKRNANIQTLNSVVANTTNFMTTMQLLG